MENADSHVLYVFINNDEGLKEKICNFMNYFCEYILQNFSGNKFIFSRRKQFTCKSHNMFMKIEEIVPRYQLSSNC